ncbi:MAG: hypothetical protein IPG60_07485 [Bacteroidetes bacterium]|nr:hypothetical protein [Bacteroidota bacterium]
MKLISRNHNTVLSGLKHIKIFANLILVIWKSAFCQLKYSNILKQHPWLINSKKGLRNQIMRLKLVSSLPLPIIALLYETIENVEKGCCNNKSQVELFEEELLIAIASSTPIQQISEQFQLETPAILEMRSNVMQKLNASNILEALAFCKKHSLLETEHIGISFN